MEENKKWKKGKNNIVVSTDFPDWMANPFREFGRQSRMMQEFFNEGFSVPRVDIEDKGDSLVIDADMPDVDKRDISLRISNGNVSIKAEKSSESVHEAKGFYAKERSSSGYYRVVKLPDDVDANTAKATYKNGTLRIEVKKAKGHGTHDIKVE